MKILLIDDDRAQRMLLRHIVSKQITVEIFEANNGIEGLRMLKMHSPDMIILDVWMPVMGGLAMLEELRKDKVYRSTPVVIMTAMGDTDTIHKALAYGIIGYILKPATTDQITNILSKIKSIVQPVFS